ncbi:hypothetical protein DER44DRAFT_801137 [Fusarium oxysporum]|nr:hypothetical protein DER44DRAFT_801137 [Fusarium oxysporum]
MVFEDGGILMGTLLEKPGVAYDITDTALPSQFKVPETPRTSVEPSFSVRRALIEAFPVSLPDFVNYVLDFLPSWESPVPPGKGRVRWKCKCGANLYDDFIELEPGSLKDLEVELQVINSGDSQSSYRNIRSITESFSAWVKLIKQMIQSMRRGSATDNLPIPLHNITYQANESRKPDLDILHLLCCLHSGETGIMLHQERIPHVSTDRELIMFLKEAYQKQRNVMPWLRLRHVSRLLLTRFELDLNCFVQVHLHLKSCQPTDCICLPTLDRVIGDEYCCRPAPEEKPKHIPVFGDNYLIHYFKSPQCLSEKQTKIFHQLPKRACGHLAALHDESALGWGIYFEEGWHWKSIYFIVVVLIVTASLVFGVCWSVFRADTQSAFAITSAWMTLGSLLLGYIAVRSHY